MYKTSTNKRIYIFVSTITGNTALVANSLFEYLLSIGKFPVLINTAKDPFPQIDKELLVVCFWCRRSGLDDASKKVLDHYKGKDILLFGTLGAYPDSPYGDRVRKNAIASASEQNNPLDIFLCQGKIPIARTEKRRMLPKESPHYLDDEGLKRHIASRSHPDENDLKNSVLFLKKFVK